MARRMGESAYRPLIGDMGPGGAGGSHGTSVGQQDEGVAVPRPKDPEVAAVKGRKLRLIETLHDRQDGGVNESDVGIGVPIAQVGDPRIVRAGDVLDSVRPALDVSQGPAPG